MEDIIALLCRMRPTALTHMSSKNQSQLPWRRIKTKGPVDMLLNILFALYKEGNKNNGQDTNRRFAKPT